MRFFQRGVRRERGETVVYVTVTYAERELLRALAERDGISTAQYIRECINDRLVEEGEQMPLLRIRRGSDHCARLRQPEET